MDKPPGLLEFIAEERRKDRESLQVKQVNYNDGCGCSSILGFIALMILLSMAGQALGVW